MERYKKAISQDVYPCGSKLERLLSALSAFGKKFSTAKASAIIATIMLQMAIMRIDRLILC